MSRWNQQHPSANNDKMLGASGQGSSLGEGQLSTGQRARGYNVLPLSPKTLSFARSFARCACCKNPAPLR